MAGQKQKLRFRLSTLFVLLTAASFLFAGYAAWSRKPTFVPVHQAKLTIYAAKKGEPSAICGGDLSLKGGYRCGPTKSLSNLDYEFIEHRRGIDYYKIRWTLTDEGKTKASKELTVGFDGKNESTVIDAEHHIVIRKEL